MATISFSSATYRYNKGDGTIELTVTRSGNEETPAVVSVASDSFEGTAAGRIPTLFNSAMLMHSSYT